MTNIRNQTQRLAVTLLVAFAGLISFAGELETKVVSLSLADAPTTQEQLERSLAELEQSGDVAVDVKVQATENYHAAIKNLSSAADSGARLKALIGEAESVASRSAQLKNQRLELKDQKPSFETGLSLQELEQILPATELQLSGFKKARQDAEAESQSRVPRRKEIRERMAVIHEKIIDASSQLNQLASVEATPQSHSLGVRLSTRRYTLEHESQALAAELTKFDAEEAAGLTRLRIEVASLQVAYTEKAVTVLQRRVNMSRESAAEEAVRMARRKAISVDPSLKVYAQENQLLAENARVLADTLATTITKLTASTKVHDNLLHQFAKTKRKVDSVGLTSSVGALLRKQITTLPNVTSRRSAVADRQKLINDTQYQLFEYEEAHNELADIDEAIEKILAKTTANSTHDAIGLESSARDLMQRKLDYLDDLVRSTGQYFDTLIELDTVDRQVIKLEAEYATYIDQRVLWIRSGPAFTEGLNVEKSDSWLIMPKKWTEAAKILFSDMKQHVVLYVLSLSLICLLLIRGRTTRLRITEFGESAEKANCRSIVPTLHGIGMTIIVSLAWPLFCLFLGWRLTQCAQGSEFTAAIGKGLKIVSVLWAFAEVSRQICRHKGIGESHFGWPVHATSTFRSEIKPFTEVAIPLAFITTTLATSDGTHERGDVQRIAFILGMCLVGFAFFRLLRPSGVIREYLSTNKSKLIVKIRYVFPLVGVALPMSLAALTAAGYFYTARTLFWRLFATCILVASLVVLRSIFYRMLLLKRRQLHMEQARERAAAAKLAAEGTGEKQSVAGIVTEIKQADISTQSEQSRNLVSTAMTAIAMLGLWMIWIQVLPALSMIGNYPLGGKSKAVAVAATHAAPMPMLPPMAAASGTNASPTAVVASNAADDDVQSNQMTVADLVFAFLIVIVTIILFRNGPGLLEISVLRQLPIDASVRYAITTLASYVIVMMGTIAACSTVGLQWSQIQWLATALTFGLAFGLQEMFANFVSGLIILVERPVRVGDVVTVDDITGVVSRIRIRATSITNWDRKEYVVPNKEFITGRLLNWTLSDKVNRVVIEVGLAHGSDTEKARSLLLQIANSHPVVLKEPASMATFEGFGEHSLNLVLRAFLPTLENRLQVIHELHTAVDKMFREADIKIAFPQRGLHIGSIADANSLPMPVSGKDTEGVDELRDAA